MPDTTKTKPEDGRSRDAEFFQSPWAEETRKTKRNLLLAATAGLATSAAGIVPKEISAFGLKVDDIDQTAYLVLLSLVIAYLLITFVLAVYSDFMRSFWDELNKFEASTLPEDETLRELVLSRKRLSGRLKDLHMFRVIIDVAIPVVVGITAIGWLICKL
ncbi:hypothetical protein KAT21_02500 [Candidatus Bathyarchaeota archaeon]|jgi:hypothetical protein|nr:hypothetical protein [Candidatus Bathyarchaeota archaeon]